jgi:hypothetical protein
MGPEPTTDAPADDTGADTTVGDPTDPSTTAGPTSTGEPDTESTGADAGCEALLEAAMAGHDYSILEVSDAWRTPEVLVEVTARIDDCYLNNLDGTQDIFRAASIAQGYGIGEHEFVIAYDGVDMPAEPLPAESNALTWLVMSNEQPPTVFRLDTTFDFPPNAWAIHLVNMTQGSMSAYAVEGDPDAPEYELLAEDVAYGEFLSAEIVATPATGARLRIDIDDVTVFEDNPMFVLDCPEGLWPVSSGMIGVVDQIEGIDLPDLNQAVAYGPCQGP